LGVPQLVFLAILVPVPVWAVLRIVRRRRRKAASSQGS
jgi:hypothetical protein